MTEQGEQASPLPQTVREEIKEIADGQADVTHDGGRRSSKWSPYLVDPETNNSEYPYNRK